MARQLRHHYAGEWYHIATRGMGQREIFCDDRDCEHFLELLEGMVGRYGIVLHAYVLIENHRTGLLGSYFYIIHLRRRP